MTIALAEADDLVLDRGAIARAAALDVAGIIGDRPMFAAMMAWVSGVVRVMWQSTWGVVIASVIIEKGSGGLSPGWRSRTAQSMVLPSRRGGVPVLRRPILRA